MRTRSAKLSRVGAWVLGLVLPLVTACDGARSTASTPPGEPQGPAPTDRVRLGERIYRDGVLPSGAPLRGLSAGGVEISGAQAACVQCHRRSGMGVVEGERIIPPIAGPFLHQARAGAMAELDTRHTRGPDLAHAFGRSRARPPYTDGALAKAIREGIDAAGVTLDPLMPRYALSEADAQLLAEYLGQLSTGWSPGVTADTIHLGTVVTPEVDPARRKAMIDVLEAFFDVKNAGTRLEKLRERPYPGGAHGAYRAWQLHVWELQGAPETWAAQLAAFEQREPVFALISGVSEGAWAPVAAFCEERGVPCWFPTVDLPVVRDGGYYAAYFEGGVLLEAQILGRRLRALHAESGISRVIQVREEDVAAAGAANALRAALVGSGVALEERVLSSVEEPALREAVHATSADAVVLWLRGPTLARLAELPPPASVHVSATLGGGERAPLSPAWKAAARMITPFELPDARRASMARFHAWRATRSLPLVDERLQADAYLACLLMSEKVDEMLESLLRDHLMERAESRLGMHVTTAMYRRLGLGPGQRFASKGGYVARFAGPEGALAADGEWIVP